MFKIKSTKISPDPNDPIYARMVEHEITIQRNKQINKIKPITEKQTQKNNNNSTKKIIF